MALSPNAADADADGPNAAGLRRDERRERLTLLGLGAPALLLVFVTMVLPVGEIDWVESAANYVKLHVGGQSFLYRQTLSMLAEELDPNTFARIHRSTIVCIDRIARIEALGHGAYRITMQSGARFDSSPTYGQRILSLLR